MSPVHFSIRLNAGVPHLQNLSDTAGTEVNGVLAEMAALRAGDQISAGHTAFVIAGPNYSPFPAQLHIGGWGFAVVPEHWVPVESLGFQFVNADSFRANISATEEPLPSNQTISSYVETQMELARVHIAEASLEGPLPLNVTGAEEALALKITVEPHNGLRVIQRQIYALSAGIVGIFTATVLKSESHQKTMDAVIGGLSYYQG